MDKKLEHIVDSMIIPFIRDRFPKWEEFIRGYYQYLDQAYFNKIINLCDNNSSYDIYDELLDDYLNTYFKNVINIEKYGLTDDNKRLFISLSKFIAGIRGNRNGFEFLFKSLKDFRFPAEGGDISVEEIDIEYYENEDWWPVEHPYTYRFKLNQSFEVMKELIDSVHPAGFIFEFLSETDFWDEQYLSDEITMSATRFPYYDAEFDYDDILTYGGVEFDPLTIF